MRSLTVVHFICIDASGIQNPGHILYYWFDVVTVSIAVAFCIIILYRNDLNKYNTEYKVKICTIEIIW